jgi:hypothetical protein
MRSDVRGYSFLIFWQGISKRKEYDAIRLRSHPYEFHLYYDVQAEVQAKMKVQSRDRKVTPFFVKKFAEILQSKNRMSRA